MLQAFAVKTTACNKITAEIKRSTSGQLGLVKLACMINNPVCLPGNYGTAVTGTTWQLPDGCTVLVEPCNSYNLPAGVVIYPTLATVNKGRVKFQVRNYNNQPVVIKHAHKVAIASACDFMQSELSVEQETATSKRIIVGLQQNLRTTVWDEEWFEKFHISETQSRTERQQIRALLYQYRDVFSKDEDDVGHVTVVKHQINTTNDIPFRQPDRPIPPAIRPEVKKILEEWLRKGIIQESCSPYASYES